MREGSISLASESKCKPHQGCKRVSICSANGEDGFTCISFEGSVQEPQLQILVINSLRWNSRMCSRSIQKGLMQQISLLGFPTQRMFLHSHFDDVSLFAQT